MKFDSRTSAMMVLAAVVTLFAIYASYASEEILLDVVKDMVLFVSAAFFSYQLAKGDAEANSETRIQDLGKATIRRIKILYSDIQSLAERVSGYDCDVTTPSELHRERYANTIDTLLRLQNAVKASFDEIKQTAKLPLNDSDLYDLPIPEEPTPARIVSQPFGDNQLTFPNKIACPRCKKICDVVVAHHGGASALKTCENCSTSFNVHRRPDGNLFCGTTNLTEASLVCPNDACQRPLTIKHKSNATIVHRACPDCFQNYDYLIQSSTVRKTAIKNETVVRELDAEGKTECVCAQCNFVIRGKPYLNNRNQRVLFCFNCGLPTLVVPPDPLTHPSSTPK